MAREVERVLELLGQAVGRGGPRVLQIGARTSVSDRNELNWRALLHKRFGDGLEFIGVDLVSGSNVDRILDICSTPIALRRVLGEQPFDLVICCHVLEHTRAPIRAARNIESMLKPGGLAYVSTPWSQAFHAAPDDYWRFSVRGLALMFERLEILTAFYSGGDVGLDVAYRVERNGHPQLDARAGAVEQGLFQVVLDHKDNRDVLSRQATERLPVSRTYLPTLFVNILGRRGGAGPVGRRRKVTSPKTR
ncbi:Methyltransferase domain-containing protein [Enhydrobacter aerosaccus]|uniref:Methyltransferase domain-containing protein n=1 Tax=Enhydrobacter aerosaccus TaxID=225324 RepID=A0A1T4QQ38_9HYPH|nr:Methyltransferase domain-containing protein [Enhydrobacter aerosaccus]